MTGKSRIPCGPTAQPVHTANKAALRVALKAARRAIDPAHKARWDAQIGAQVLAWWDTQAQDGAALLGVYWPLPGEPDLLAAYAELARRGASLVLPVVLARDAALGFAFWTPGEPMIKDAMGVAVPQQSRPAPAPDALLLPCLGFNQQRYRLGYGGGFYDRTLAALPRPATAGVAYACQASDFATGPHDVALDLIITEDAGA